MSRHIRFVSAFVGSACLAAVALGSPAAADTAANLTQVSIDTLASGHDSSGTVTPGQTVTGTADVTFTVHADPDYEPYAAVVSITGHTNAQGTGEVSQRIDLAAGDCLPSCTLHAAVDTAATKKFGGTDTIAAPLVEDGANEIRVEVFTARPEIRTATADVTVDNDRPIVTLPDVPGEDAWTSFKPVGLTADQRLNLRAVATDTGGGVSRVEYFSNHPVWPAASDLAGPDSDGMWTGTVDTSKVQSALWPSSAYVVAFDNQGRAGSPVRATTLVDHGFTVTTAVKAVIRNVPDTAFLTYKYPRELDQPWPRNLNYAYPVSTRVTLDGALLATTRVSDFVLVGYQNYFYARLGDKPLPYGKHTLTFDVTDNRGAHGTTNVPINVVSGIDPTWTAGLDNFSVAGKPWKFAANTHAADKVSHAQNWTLTVDGKTISTGTYPAQPSGTWTAGTPGMHEVSLTMVSQFGDSSVSTQPIRVLAATATKLTGPALTTYGAKQNLTATVTQTGSKPATGAQISLQFRPADSITWTTVAKATADSKGTAHFTTTAKRNGTWRAVTAAKNLAWASSTSSTVTGHVKATLSMKSPATKAHHGKAVACTAVSSPYAAGTWIQYQIRKSNGTWTTLTTAKLATNGTAAGKLTFAHTGTYTLRAYRPATVTLAASSSAAWTVRVS
ncbi:MULTISPECIES: hypothetical protein [unclassified Streptomyces]|uniref:hypothetical protein n=1 Tax=unclassified Streptomyces TaxID=2593676 RepID=UPI003823F081